MKIMQKLLFRVSFYRSKTVASMNVFLFTLLASSAFSATDTFVHTVSSENVSGHMTRIDHEGLNGFADKLLFVTPRFGKYNPHTVGVWFEEETALWTIYNEDRTYLPVDAQFNVIAFEPQSPQAFTHTATLANTKDYYTLISHPASDYNPDATLLITPNWSEAYVPGPLGVWYDGERWSIYRQDKKPLKQGTRFNVLVLNEGPNSISGLDGFNVTSITHRSNEANTRGHVTTLERRNPDEIIMITHNWKDNGPYNNDVPGVWYNGENWTILNQDREKIETGAKFNSIILTPTQQRVVKKITEKVPTEIDTRMGWMQVQNKGDFEIQFDLIFELDGKSRAIRTGPIASGATETFRVPMRAQDIRLTGEAKQGGISRVVVDRKFTSVPNGAYAVSSTLLKPKWDKAEVIKF